MIYLVAWDSFLISYLQSELYVLQVREKYSNLLLRLPGAKDICDKELTGLVRAPHQRTTGGVQKSELISTLFPLLKLGGRHVLVHFQVTTCWLHVLAQGDAIYSDAPQVVERLFNLLIGLAKSQHYRRLGDNIRSYAFGLFEYPQRLAITRSSIPHERGQGLHRFYVVRKNIKTGFDYVPQTLGIPPKVRTQALDEYLRISRLYLGDRRSNVLRTAVRKV